MHTLHVNPARCTMCGTCARVCPLGVMTMGQDGPADIAQGCIACGHCVAVCPHDALSRDNAPRENQSAIDAAFPFSPEKAMAFLRGRRSIRAYTNQSVPRALIADVLNAARFAPTASNSQGIAYMVMEEGAPLRAVTRCVVAYHESLPAIMPSMARRLARYHETGYDGILLGAPCLIIATADASAPKRRSRDSAVLELIYAQLYAPSLGLGTCWAGIVEACAFAGYAPLLDVLRIPAGQTVVGALMLGYPDYAYFRMPDRDNAMITWHNAQDNA